MSEDVSMLRLYVALLLTSFFLSAPFTAHAQQAVVRSYDAPELEVGQAWLMHSGGRCYAIMPHHVAMETSVPSLLREDARGLRGEASETVDLGDDATIAHLFGRITQDCGYSVGSISRAIERRLRDGGLGALRSVNGDGTLGRLAVTVVDDDGAQFLRVLPTVEGERIRKGHSGSLLVLGDQPVGMLLSVHARSGVGTVMRADALLAKVDGYLRGTRTAETASVVGMGGLGGTLASPGLSQATDTWQVTGWDTDPLGSQHVAGHLTAPGEAGFWAVRTEHWPVALDLDGPGSVRVVRGVELHAGEARDPAMLPARVQVLSSVNAERPSWRAVGSTMLEFTDGVARFEFLPVRARMLRIEIYTTQGDTREIVLGRLRVLEEDS